MSSEISHDGLIQPVRVFATVGTDHHPFYRLVEWLDDWLGSEAADGVDCLVQRGTSAPARLAPSRDYLVYPEMEAALRNASAVVSHGGPGTIMLALAAGKKPIVVPRSGALGEHVDDHQVAFARRIANRGTIWLAETRQRLHELLDTVLALPEQFLVETPRLEEDLTFRKVEQLVDALIARGTA